MAELGRARPVVLAAIATILTANVAILSSNRASIERTDSPVASTTSTTTQSNAVVLFGKADSPMAIPTVFRVLPDGSSLMPSARPAVRTDQRLGGYKFFSTSEGIAVARANGVGAVQLTHGGLDSSPRLDPNGHTVAYLHRLNDTVNGVGFVTVRGQPLGYLVPPAGDSYDAFTWSPDGTSVAVLRTSSSGAAVYVASLVGEAPHEIARGDFHDLAWSHDGTRIAVVRSNDVWVMATDGSSAVRLTRLTGTRFVAQPMWSPDDTQVAFLSIGAHEAIDVVQADGTALTTAYETASLNCAHCEFISLFGWAPRGNMAA